MIIEGLCTTRNADGSVNLAPMGPVVNAELSSFRFRPFQSSLTFQNLKRTGCGVFHITDDAALIARAAIHRVPQLPECFPAKTVAGDVLASACRWYEFEVVAINDSQPRTEIETRLTHVGHLREFWGFNRARHALLEAAILATRLHLISAAEIEQEFARLQTIVDKTASDADATAYADVKQYVDEQLRQKT